MSSQSNSEEESHDEQREELPGEGGGGKERDVKKKRKTKKGRLTQRKVSNYRAKPPWKIGQEKKQAKIQTEQQAQETEHAEQSQDTANIDESLQVQPSSGNQGVVDLNFYINLTGNEPSCGQNIQGAQAANTEQVTNISPDTGDEPLDFDLVTFIHELELISKQSATSPNIDESDDDSTVEPISVADTDR